MLGGVGPFGADRYPFRFLTFVVSLEASFLSTFVMIRQNRRAAFQQAKANHDSHEAETELKSNTALTRAIHAMTQEIHAIVEEVREQTLLSTRPAAARLARADGAPRPVISAREPRGSTGSISRRKARQNCR